MPDDHVDWPHLHKLVAHALKGWRRDHNYDDYHQVALTAAWQHHHRPDPHIVRRARSAAIDEHRRIAGRTGTQRHQTRHVQVPDLPQPTRPLPPSVELGLTGRQAVIADLVAEGFHHTDIAQALGVTPSAITKTLRRTAQRLERAA